MRPPGAILAPGESLIATGNKRCMRLGISFIFNDMHSSGLMDINLGSILFN